MSKKAKNNPAKKSNDLSLPVDPPRTLAEAQRLVVAFLNAGSAKRQKSMRNAANDALISNLSESYWDYSHGDLVEELIASLTVGHRDLPYSLQPLDRFVASCFSDPWCIESEKDWAEGCGTEDAHAICVWAWIREDLCGLKPKEAR